LGENGTQVFSGYFEMTPGSEHAVRFQYRLPSGITPESYKLVVRRQSGAGPLPLAVDAAGHRLDTEIVDGQFVWDPPAD
jgi:hypothetical protein